jgi:hypothetical protein
MNGRKLMVNFTFIQAKIEGRMITFGTGYLSMGYSGYLQISKYFDLEKHENGDVRPPANVNEVKLYREVTSGQYLFVCSPDEFFGR